MTNLNVAMFVCFLAIIPSSTVSAQGDANFSGAILKLSEITNRQFTVNVGGLVIAIVHDSGSRPPQNIKVDAPRAFQPLGIVRGTQNDKGQPLMGGGYTWYLFKPVTAGDSTFKVSYTENGDGKKQVQRNYKVTVEQQD